MDLALTVDKATSPVLVSTAAGVTTVTYTLVVDSHLFNIDSVSVVDTLPANWTFDNNSAVITLPNLTQISGAAANPTVSLPTLTWGAGLLGNMLPNQQITITFTARTTAATFANGDMTRNRVEAVGTRTVGGVTQTFKATDFVFNTFTDGSVGMQLTKTSSVPVATPVSPGDTLTYTMTVTNPATATTTLTGVTLYDPLPAGVSYVPASGSVTCERARNVRDQFDNPGLHGQQRHQQLGHQLGRNRRLRDGRRRLRGRLAGTWRSRAAPCSSATCSPPCATTSTPTASTRGNNGSNNWATQLDRDNDDNNAERRRHPDRQQPHRVPAPRRRTVRRVDRQDGDRHRRDQRHGQLRLGSRDNGIRRGRRP